MHTKTEDKRGEERRERERSTRAPERQRTDMICVYTSYSCRLVISKNT
jgi:hypothetical protein